MNILVPEPAQFQGLADESLVTGNSGTRKKNVIPSAYVVTIIEMRLMCIIRSLILSPSR